MNGAAPTYRRGPMRFSALELQQLAAIAGVCLAVVFLFVALFRWLEKMDAIWPQTAKKLGLRFREQSSGNPLLAASRIQSKVIEGVLDGVPIRLVASRETIGNVRRATTVVSAVVQTPGAPFTVQIAKGAQRPESQFHAIPLGDAEFDQKVMLSGEQPAAVRARFDRSVRAAILAVPIDQLGLTVTATEVTLSLPWMPFRANEVEALIRAARTIAGAAPTNAPVPAPSVPKRDAYLGQLAEGFGFTLEQLDANRRGEIHESQRKKVGVGCGPFVAIFFTLATLGGGVGGAFALYDDFRKPISRTDMNGIYALGGAGVVLGLICLAITISAFRGVAARKRAYLGRPEVVEGPVQKVSISGRYVAFKLNLGGRTFVTPKKGWDLITQSARYRVYAVHGELISVEPATGTPSSG